MEDRGVVSMKGLANIPEEKMAEIRETMSEEVIADHFPQCFLGRTNKP